ncbi:hypothetical protein NCCP2716_21910 [Sporosarcina sp. NCCP-2716]|uniref:hypothetical protein n=1 Tax=Sporosarcina sp. NCCP-2716 TaxID=2943679 RepID=UPI00203AD4CB|nr:hypothetical protein [Sporosarcina sp. NCCP-2716]GKV69693.1 hypothetical protein NCCP2716_21910 [Sporosarcina sp. NCCP-2716]
MGQRKILIFPILSLAGILLASGCADEKSEWIPYADRESLNDISRDYLINCLDDRGIEFKLDNEKNILIQQRDLDMAAASCS